MVHRNALILGALAAVTFGALGEVYHGFDATKSEQAVLWPLLFTAVLLLGLFHLPPRVRR